MKTETATTHQLKNGDRVTCHNAVLVLINRRVSKAHDAHPPGGECIAFDTIYKGKACQLQPPGIPAHWRTAANPWVIQGNGLAKWARIISE